MENSFEQSMEKVIKETGLEFVQNVDEENTFEISKNAHWLKLNAETTEELGKQTVEGRYLRPEGESNRKIIIVFPGFGADVKGFEDKYVEEFLSSGYSMFVGRYNGSVIDANNEKSRELINCDEVFSKGREHLGDKESYSMKEWAVEPMVAMKSFQGYDEIYLIGYSFGGIAEIYSLSEMQKSNPESLEKVKKVLLLSGITGEDMLNYKGQPGDKVTSVMTGEAAEQSFQNAVASKIRGLSPVVDNMKDWVEVCQHNYNPENKITKDITFILVNPDKDELLQVDESKYFADFQGRGITIRDFTEKLPNQKTFHSNRQIESKILKRLIEGLNYPKKRRDVEVGKTS